MVLTVSQVHVDGLGEGLDNLLHGGAVGVRCLQKIRAFRLTRGRGGGQRRHRRKSAADGPGSS
jgi:hypothetical protein